ncbi:HAD family hydrolase [Microbacterium gorillae]|uniref:HAD family hydrolase n=1 Tax=Microbacterium gorillae TaxID=1231063 RepID=UPI00058EE134|nr:HAD family phosphatase [Microbacterium gorillae]
MTDSALRAVLWDMDGTIVDTEPLWMAAEIELIRGHGGTWTHEDGLRCVGLSLDASARLFQEAGVDLAVPEIIRHLSGEVMKRIAAGDVEYRPGARELLASTTAAGLSNVIVTMSYRAMAAQVADLLPAGTFTAVVAGDEVTRGKPFADPYLQGARAAGVAPTACVAIEDSPNGVRSGIAAKITTIGVPHMVPLEGVGATEIWSTLQNRTAEDLRAVHERHLR